MHNIIDYYPSQERFVHRYDGDGTLILMIFANVLIINYYRAYNAADTARRRYAIFFYFFTYEIRPRDRRRDVYTSRSRGVNYYYPSQ